MGSVFGLVSTLQVRWSNLAGTLHDSGARATGGRAKTIGRRTLVIAEVSLSLMLLIGASLLALSFVRLQRVQPGFVPDNTLSASIVLPIPGGFDPKRDGPGWAQFFSQLTGQLAKSPNVESVGAVSTLPLTGTAEGGALDIVGQPRAEAGQAPRAEYAVVEGDLFQDAQDQDDRWSRLQLGRPGDERARRHRESRVREAIISAARRSITRLSVISTSLMAPRERSSGSSTMCSPGRSMRLRRRRSTSPNNRCPIPA